jgi:hypothetical protein
MSTTGRVRFCGAGKRLATDVSRVSFAFCSSERASCMGFSFLALRYAVEKSLHASCVCGIASMRLKLGKRRTLVVLGVVLAGSEDAVMRTLWKGYII